MDMATTLPNNTLLAFDSNRSESLYQLAEQTLSSHTIDTFRGKSSLTVATMNDKEIISYSFDVEKGLKEEELADTVDIRMFQDAGLNHMIDYKIVYATRDSLLDAKSLSVTAFAVTPTQFTGEFGALRSRCNYIDTILPSSTLPHALYAGEILEAKSDIFIYFREKETTFSVFYEGRFVYSKNISEGLKGLYDLFVKNNNETVEYDTFVTTLTGKGLDPDRYETEPEVYRQDVAAVLERSLGNMNNVIQYARRIAGIQSFDRIFIGTEKGTVPMLTELVRSVTEVRGENFEFFTPYYHAEDSYTDQTIILGLIEAENIREGRPANPFNLSIYPRPPRFYKRDSGKLLLITAASLLLGTAYPLYLAVDTRWKEYTYNTTLGKLQISQGEFMELKAEEDSYRAKKNHYQELLEKEKEALAKQLALLKKIESKRQLATTKTHTLARLFGQLNRHRLKIEQIEIEGDRYRLALRSRRDDDVTAFLKTATAHKHFSVDMHAYAYNPEIKRYQTLITIKVSP